MTPRELTNEIVKILDKKKALDITAIKTEELTIVSDYFVIATGTSNTHVKSLAAVSYTHLDVYKRQVFVAAAGVHGGRLLLTFCLPSVLYTVIFTPLWFLITRGISRLLPSEVKR